MRKRFVQEFPGILVSPAPASQIIEPTVRGVEELGIDIVSPAPSTQVKYPTRRNVEETRIARALRIMGFLYEDIWRPIPKTHAPPQNIPGVEKMSPEIGWKIPLAIGFIGGLIIGLPLGRALLMKGLRMTEAEVRRRAGLP